MQKRLTSLNASRGVRWTRKLGNALLLTFWIVLGCAAPVFAVGGGRLALGSLDQHAFPRLTFTLEIDDPNGQAQGELKPSDLQLLEDGTAASAGEVKLQNRPLQFSIAINESPGLGAAAGSETARAKTQLEAVKQALESWISASGPGASGDEYSLATNTGMQVIRARTLAELNTGLSAYQPDLAKAAPSLSSLITALDLAVDTASKGVSKPAVLFITPPLSDKEAEGLDAQTARAVQLHTPVFVWVVVPAANSQAPDVTKLQALAEQSGGALAAVSAGGTFPDLGAWLQPLRQIYQVSYQSSIRTSGEHELSVKLARGGATLSADSPLRFKLDVKPPNPMFVNPPETLARAWTTATRDQPAALTPDSLALQLLIEFPDGYKRPLRATRLYANDKLVAENTSEPFDRFAWKLDGVSESGTVRIRAEAEDILGLSASTIELPLEVSIAAKPRPSLLPHITSQGLIAVGAVALAGAILALVVLGENRLRGRGRRALRNRAKDPVTQPVQIQSDKPRSHKTIPQPNWPRAATPPSAPARLVRLNEAEQAIAGNTVPLNRTEITLGSDPHLANVPFEDASVQPIHARLARTREGSFVIADEGSVAGTWVNFHQLNGEGRRLQHGDLIHLGRVMLRFELAQAPRASEPQVSLVEERP